MKKGRKLTVLLLAVMMVLGPITVKADDTKATHVVSGIPNHVTVTVDDQPVEVVNGKVNAAPEQWVSFYAEDGYRIVSLAAREEVESTHPTTVYVTLTADDVWGDGSGYQMLIDADGTAYGDIIPTNGGLTTSGDASAAVYAEFEYKIPANADGSLTTSNIILDNSVTIEIPAGTYDYCITNPTPGDRVWIASDNGAAGGRADDFVFEAGKEYEFVVSLHGSNDGVELTVGPGVLEVYAIDNGFKFQMGENNVTVDAKVEELPDYIYFWDFEDNEQLSDWMGADLDEDGHFWGRWTGGAGHNSDGALGSQSWTSNDGALKPDNLIITPAINVPADGAVLDYWVADYNYPETYQVYIFDGDPTDENTLMYPLGGFDDDGEVIDFETPGEALVYEEFAWDISYFAGTTIYVGFRHYNCSDGNYLFIDDVGILAEGDSGELQLEEAGMDVNGINVEWTDLGADKYEVYRDGVKQATVTATSYKDEAAAIQRTMGSTYVYQVKAIVGTDVVAESKPVEILYNPFSDVSESSYYFDYIAWAFNHKIVNGVAGTVDQFNPQGDCERMNFCYMLWKMMGTPKPGKKSPFKDLGDLSANNVKAITWCYNKKIVAGFTKTTFKPHNSITRAQLAIMVWKTAGKPSVTGLSCPYTDIEISDTMTPNNQKAIIWCYNYGLIDSISGDKFQPDLEGTRELLTEMLYGLNEIKHYVKNANNNYKVADNAFRTVKVRFTPVNGVSIKLNAKKGIESFVLDKAGK
ncbi:MAG: DUF2436 domain-containing protein [Erysipelotrichaceae bacterium]|nr:DUF2436 domain-containing protein [Erysipelotrichaceae bacterium]